MGTTEEFLRLITEVKGAQALADLKKQLADIDAEAAKLKAQFDAQAISEAELEVQTRKLAATSAQLKATLGESTNKMAGFGQSALQSGRVIQDFAQGGLGGILNNIEGLTMALGLGPGLAGTLTIVGVGFFALKPLIAEAAKELGLFGKEVDHSKNQVEQLSEKIKELKEKPARLAVETNELVEAEKELDRLTKGFEALKALSEGKTKYEKEASSKIKEAIEEGGAGDTIRRELTGSMAEEIMANDPILKKLRADKEAAQKRLAELEASPDEPFRKTQMEEARMKIEDPAAREKARARREEILRPKGIAEAELGTKILDPAVSGKDPEALRMLADRLAKIGRGELGMKIGGMTAEAMKAEADKKEADKEADKEARKAEKDEKDEAAANKKRSDAAIHAFDTETDAVEKEAKAKRTAEDRSRTATTSFERGRGKSEAREIAEQVGAISEAGTIDERAGAMAAQFRGGLGGRNGRALPENAQFNQLADMIRAEVRAEHPGIGRAESDLVAQQMAKTAFKSVDALGVMVNSQEIMLERLRDAEQKIARLGAHAVTLNEGARHRQTTIPGS